LAEADTHARDDLSASDKCENRSAPSVSLAAVRS